MTDPARDPLDQAIDRVAARMVNVDHDEAMTERIVARLPERNGLGGWLRVLAPQAAIAVALIVAAVVAIPSRRAIPSSSAVPAGEAERFQPPSRHPGVSAREVPAVPAAMPGVDAPIKATRVAARRVAARRVTETAAALPADHERSLAPVGEPIALEVVSLASPSLPEEALVVLAPIVLTELPLSGESILPR